MKCIVIFILSIFFSYNCLSQDEKIIIDIDSILINKVDSLNILGINLLYKKPTKGIKLNKKALKISKEINYKKGEAISLNNISRHNYVMAQYDIAQKQVFEALEIHKQIDYKKGILISYQSLGVIYRITEKYDEAIENINKAIELGKRINNNFSVAISYGNIAIVYKELENYEEAIKNYNLSLEIFKKENNEYQIARTLHNMGNLYIKLKQYDKALNLNTQALERFKKIDNKIGIVVSSMSYGSIYTKKGKYQLAEKHLKEAYKKSRDIEYFIKEATLYRYFYNLYKTKKDYKKALRYYTLYKELHEKEISEKGLRNITFAKERYQTKLKENENQNLLIQQKLNKEKIKSQEYFIFIIVILFTLVIISALLRYRQKVNTNKVLKKQKEELTILVNKLNNILKEKNRIMSILSHDLKNPFNVIIGLLDTLNSDYEDLSNKERIEYIQICERASKSAYTLLSDILTWARTQSEGIQLSPLKTNLHELCEKSINVLKPTAQKKGITLKNIINKDIVIKVDQFTLSTVINNITSNALKFTEEGGSIIISTETNKNNILIKIKDTGVGMSESKIEKLFKLDNNITTLGTNNEKGTGLGLLICHEFIILNKGKIIVESKEGKGSTFIINIPM